MNSTQTLYEIIDIVEKIRRLDRVLDENEAAVAELTATSETEVGYKRTIAKCRLREAQDALDAAKAEYNDLSVSIPAPDDLPRAYSVGLIADLRIKRGGLLRDKKGLGKRLSAEEEALKSGPWRRKDAPTPPVILDIQSKMANIDLAVARVDAEIMDWMKGIHAEENAKAEKNAFNAWMADETCTVVPPAGVVERQKQEYEDFLRNSVKLEFSTPAVIARRTAERRAAAEESARALAEEAAWKAEESIQKVRKARAATKEREFFARLIAANKRRVAAVRNNSVPQLIVEECM